MLTHCCQVLSFYTLSETWNIIQLDFWWYKNETLRSNMLKKATLKKTEKCVIKDYPYITIVFYLWSFFSFKLFFFPHLIYLPQLIVDKKRISVIFKQKGKEIVNWHKNEGFPVVSKGKGWNYCISNLEYTLLTFLWIQSKMLYVMLTFLRPFTS